MKHSPLLPPLLIGVSARIHHAGACGMPSSGVWSKTVNYLEQSVAHWLLGGGAMPVMVPALDAGSMARHGDLRLDHYAAALDGLLLQGGHDVAPESYGETPLHADWCGDRVRDRCEIDLVRAFVAAGKPVFGICRGLQLLNVAFGGTLWQDIPTQRPEAGPHRVEGRYEHHHHRIEFVPGTPLAALFPHLQQATTNSIHHQGIKTLAPDFFVEATCPDDGQIEAARWCGPGYVAGVQWHPEFHAADDPRTVDDRPIRDGFLAAARTARATPTAQAAQALRAARSGPVLHRMTAATGTLNGG